MRRRAFLCLLAPVFAVLFGTGFVVGSAHLGGTMQASAYTACYHNDTSNWDCPDTSLALRAAPGVRVGMTAAPKVAVPRKTMLPADEILSGSLTVQTRNHRSVTFNFTGPFDAVFVTKNSMTRVLRGYYVSKGDKKQAAAVQRRIDQMP